MSCSEPGCDGQPTTTTKRPGLAEGGNNSIVTSGDWLGSFIS